MKTSQANSKTLEQIMVDCVYRIENLYIDSLGKMTGIEYRPGEQYIYCSGSQSNKKEIWGVAISLNVARMVAQVEWNEGSSNNFTRYSNQYGLSANYEEEENDEFGYFYKLTFHLYNL